MDDVSHETSDAPVETPRTETEHATTGGFGPVNAVAELRTRLRALRHLRRGQLVVLALLVVAVGLVTVAPPALTGFLGTFVATVTLLVVAPHLVVRAVTSDL